MELKKIPGRLLFETRRYFANKLRERKYKSFEPHIDNYNFTNLFNPELGFVRNDKNKIIDHFRTRSHPKFYFDIQTDGPNIKNILKNEFDCDQDKFISDANHILDGKLRLLGTDFAFKKGCFDWHFDPISKTNLPLKNWKKAKLPIYTDYKPIAELNRHAHFPFLAKAFFLTENKKYILSLLAPVGKLDGCKSSWNWDKLV